MSSKRLLPVNPNTPPIRLADPREDREQRRLAASISADNPDAFPWICPKRDIFRIVLPRYRFSIPVTSNIFFLFIK